MATRYWVGGSGTWDATSTTNWSATSGGAGGASAPTSADDVIIDANSGTGTITCTGALCGDITVTASQAITLGTNPSTLSVFGNLTFPSGGSFGVQGNISLTFSATTTGKTITTNGKSLGLTTIFNGVGGGWTLGSALTVPGASSTITFTNGTFDTSSSGNYAITSGAISLGVGTKTLNLNASTVTLASGSSINFNTNNAGFTFNAGTSTINCVNPNVSFAGGGQTFYNVTIGDTQNNSHTMTGANVFNNLTLNDRALNGTNRLSLAANITVNGTFTSNGTQTLPYRRYWIYSSVGGTNRTITAAAINIFGTDFRNITGAGVASWTDSTRTKYWGDAGGNSGITFATGRNVYWNLAGTQNWYNTGWALTNNGSPAADNYPLIQDTAIFTEAGAAGTITLDTQGLMIPTVTMADGVSNRTSAMTLNFGFYDRDNFFGNITFFSNLTLSGGGTSALRNIRLSGYNNTQLITSSGKTIPINIEIDEGYNNTVQLQDSLTLENDQTFTLTQGTLDLNSKTLTTGIFSSSNSNTRAIAFGTGNITTTGSGTVWNQATGTGLTYTGTPTVNISNNSATATTVTAGTTGGASTNAFNFNFTTGTYSLTLTTASVVGALNFTGFTGTWAPGTATCTFYGSLTLVSGMTFTTGSGVWTWANTTGTAIITSAGKTLFSITQNGTGGTVQLASGTTTLSNTYTLTNGTLDLNNNTLSTGLFASSNSNARTIAYGTGNITVTGSGTTVWSCATVTNLTLTGTPNNQFTYSGSVGTRIIAHGTSAGGSSTTAVPMTITAGSDEISTTSSHLTDVLYQNTFSGIPSGSGNIYGNWTYSTATLAPNASSLGPTFLATSGTKTINTRNVSIDRPWTINGAGGTFQIVDNFTLISGTSTGTFTLTAGTLDLNNKNLTTNLFSSSNSNVRALLMRSGTITLSGTGTVWNAATSTNFTITPGTSTILLSDTSSSTKTFAGGGLTYNNLIISSPAVISGGGVTLSGSNRFNTLSCITLASFVITFTAGTTTTVNNWNISGTSSAGVIISSSAASAFTIAKSGSGAFAGNNLNISYMTASPTTFYAFNSVSTFGNNTGVNLNTAGSYGRVSNTGILYVPPASTVFDEVSQSNISTTQSAFYASQFDEITNPGVPIRYLNTGIVQTQGIIDEITGIN